MIVFASFVTLSLLLIGLTKHRNLLLYLLILIFSLEPRLPIGRFANHQRADIRFSDIIILSMFLTFIILAATGRVKIKYKTHMFFLAAFIVSAFFSSFLGWLHYYYNPVYSLLFFIRVFEYASLAFIVPCYITSEKDLKYFFLTYFSATLINIAWLLFQLATNNKGPLLETVKLAFYGYTLLSISPPFSVGAVWLLSFTLFITYYLLYDRKIIILPFIAISAGGLFLSFSRTVIATSLIVIFFISFMYLFHDSKFKQKASLYFTIWASLFAASFALAYSLTYFENLPFYRLDIHNALTSLYEVRFKQIWMPLLRKFSERAFLGYGVGNIGKLHQSFDEGHNYFIRLLIEVGAVGFLSYSIFFIMFLFNALKIFFKKVTLSGTYGNFVPFYIIIWLFALFFLSLAQDSLQTPEIAIPTFILIGITNWLLCNNNVANSVRFPNQRQPLIGKHVQDTAREKLYQRNTVDIQRI